MGNLIYDAASVKNDIIGVNRSNIAFVIGNGINLYKNKSENKSWNNLLKKIRKISQSNKSEEINEGINLTEYFDILELSKEDKDILYNTIKEELSKWKCKTHIKQIYQKIKNQYNAPILTTNFDEVFEREMGLQLFPLINTDHYKYLWSSYFCNKKNHDVLNAFAIWHINGMISNPKTIKIGLVNYVNSIRKAKILIDNLYHVGIEEWKGKSTWLEIFLKKPLFIFGLGLNTDEVFLRWLLIQKAIYLNRTGIESFSGWYITTKCDICKNPGKKNFLESFGIKVIEVNGYEDIYERMWE